MSAVDAVLTAWRNTTRIVAATPADFLGRDKEARVLRALRREIEALAPDLALSGPDVQTKFECWSIDLVCGAPFPVAVEAKYKTLRDGAVPDNRKAAFFDLYRLEQYVASGTYSLAVFLWLTNHPAYRRPANGDSAAFSTHEGREYRAGTRLVASRSRNTMPVPLTLHHDLTFRWELVDSVGGWHSLALLIPGQALKRHEGRD